MNMSARDPDAIGMILQAKLTMGIMIEMIPLKFISENADHIAQMIQAAEHSSGHPNIAVGGSMESVRISLKLLSTMHPL